MEQIKHNENTSLHKKLHYWQTAHNAFKVKAIINSSSNNMIIIIVIILQMSHTSVTWINITAADV